MISITSPEKPGKVLRRHRKDPGLTQSQVGQKFNIPQKTVSNIKAGRPGVQLATLFKLLSALNLEITLRQREALDNEEALW